MVLKWYGIESKYSLELLVVIGNKTSMKIGVNFASYILHNRQYTNIF